MSETVPEPAYDEVWSFDATGPVFGERRGATIYQNVHNRGVCAPHPCWLHAPTDHHMREWPTVYRADAHKVERQCPHGVGHPDPDDMDYQIRRGREWQGLHGCDGCCRRPS